MNKVKTKKIVSKRFKITKTGKVMYRKQGARHLRRKKNKRRQRRQDKMLQVKTRAFERSIKRFLAL